jgi:hypothetical protein
MLYAVTGMVGGAQVGQQHWWRKLTHRLAATECGRRLVDGT